MSSKYQKITIIGALSLLLSISGVASGASKKSHLSLGASSGGGGYVSENSMLILNLAKQEIVAKIRSATPAIFLSLAKRNWTQQKFADLLENIRISPLKEVQPRNGSDIMFNYGTDAQGPYIEVLRPFFFIYGAIPIKFISPEEVRNILLDVQLKMVHEAAHHLGLNESNADSFAMSLLRHLDRDFIYCQVDVNLLASSPWTVMNVDPTTSQPNPPWHWVLRNGWLIHRAYNMSAFHMQNLLTTATFNSPSRIAAIISGDLWSEDSSVDYVRSMFTRGKIDAVYLLAPLPPDEKYNFNYRQEIPITKMPQYSGLPAPSVFLHLKIENQPERTWVSFAEVTVPVVELLDVSYLNLSPPDSLLKWGTLTGESHSYPLTCVPYYRTLTF